MTLKTCVLDNVVLCFNSECVCVCDFKWANNEPHRHSDRTCNCLCNVLHGEWNDNILSYMKCTYLSIYIHLNIYKQKQSKSKEEVQFLIVFYLSVFGALLLVGPYSDTPAAIPLSVLCRVRWLLFLMEVMLDILTVTLV